MAQPFIEAWLGTQVQLAKANERPAAVQHINAECIRMHKEALARATKRRFLGIL